FRASLPASALHHLTGGRLLDCERLPHCDRKRETPTRREPPRLPIRAIRDIRRSKKAIRPRITRMARIKISASTTGRSVDQNLRIETRRHTDVSSFELGLFGIRRNRPVLQDGSWVVSRLQPSGSPVNGAEGNQLSRAAGPRRERRGESQQCTWIGAVTFCGGMWEALAEPAGHWVLFHVTLIAVNRPVLQDGSWGVFAKSPSPVSGLLSRLQPSTTSQAGGFSIANAFPTATGNEKHQPAANRHAFPSVPS